MLNINLEVTGGGTRLKEDMEEALSKLMKGKIRARMYRVSYGAENWLQTVLRGLGNARGKDRCRS
jgi:hypothetical protein